jgi:hypothetical protein
MMATAAVVVTVVAALLGAVAVTKTLAATAMEVVIDNNQPKMAAEKMAHRQQWGWLQQRQWQGQ